MSNLKTNYKDAELSPSMNGKRQYELQYNEAGYTNLVDKTAYTEVGDTFGADDINATNSAVNELNQNLIFDEFSITNLTFTGGSSVANLQIPQKEGYKVFTLTLLNTVANAGFVLGQPTELNDGRCFSRIFSTSSGKITSATALVGYKKV